MDKRKNSAYFPLNKFHFEYNRKISAYFTYAGSLITMNPTTSIYLIKKLAELTSTSSAFYIPNMMLLQLPPQNGTV
mgnify:CR=1 FL=1